MATRMGVLLLTCSVALGCGSDAIPPSAPADTPGPTLTPQVGEAYCYVAFSPDEELREATELAAARWSLATGCEVVVAEGGIPIELAASVERPDGSQAPGVTSEDRKLIQINARSSATQRTSSVFHEMGHALGGDHTLTQGVLSGEKGRVDIIDQAALDTVCSRLACGAVSPEAP